MGIFDKFVDVTSIQGLDTDEDPFDIPKRQYDFLIPLSK